MEQMPTFYFARLVVLSLLIGSNLVCKSQAFITTSSSSTHHLTSYPISSSRSSRFIHSHRRRKRRISHSNLSFPPITTSTTTTTMMSSQKDDNSPIDDETYQSIVERIVKTVGSSTTAVVSGTFFAALAYQRDAIMVLFCIGAISNGILAKVLKKIWNQDRPVEHLTNDNIKLKPGDKGMPSSHAMSLGFIGTFTYLLLTNTPLFSPFLVASILLPYIYCSLSYRIKGGLHTLDQVAVGLTLGSSNGWFWYSLVMGNNLVFPNINISSMVGKHLLPESGIFPIPYLIIPALMGLALVGSLDRRIGQYWSNQ